MTPTIVGRYALFDVIGGGGMAQVHLGRILGAAGFSRVVAVKRLHPHAAMDPMFVAMLTDEARVASRIRHPNVVPMLDVVAHGKELLLVMEYATGLSLGQVVQLAATHGVAIPQPVAVRLVLDVLGGLEAAHNATDERGMPLALVHRDISPQNVIAGTDGHARIVDFGIAKAENRTSGTDAGQVKGKLGYMPPEQLCGEPIDRRADVYAIGVVLWELLTGKRLFEPKSDELMVLLRQALELNALPPSTFVDAPIELDAVVMRAVEREAVDRFPTAAEMSAALEAAAPAASAKEVAAFVARLGGPALAERAELVARVEQTAIEEAADPGPSPVPVYTPPRRPVSDAVIASAPPVDEPVPPPPSSSSLGALVAVLIGVVVAGILVVTYLFARPEPAAPPVTPLVAASTGLLASPPPSMPPSEAPSSTLTVIGDEAAPPTPSAPVVRQAHRPPKPSCDPPYTIDARGIRIPRRECFGK